jgi:nucleoside-diphosphate-sugar epimerase
MRVLVTGANGFVGRATVQSLAKKGHSVVAQTRHMPAVPWPADSHISSCVTDFDHAHALDAALPGCDWVVHTAARVHQVNDTATNPLEAYRQVNTNYTLVLAHAAAAQGIKRFVFLSSVKVNGEWTAKDQPFRADGTPAPADPYGISKLEAELGLRAIAAQTGMQVVIVRPPLVYGPGVKANFLTMMRWLQRGVPLPLGAIHNQRSLVGLDNLVDLLETCLAHPAAANQTFLASDGHDVSTTELLAALAMALQVKARLLPLPQPWLERALALAGRQEIAKRLCGNLAVDTEKIRTLLGWTPPYSLAQGLQATAAHFLAHR